MYYIFLFDYQDENKEREEFMEVDSDSAQTPHNQTFMLVPRYSLKIIYGSHNYLF